MIVDRPGPAYFDATHGTWVLSRFVDVHTALRDPQLVVHGTSATSRSVHLEVRRAAAATLSMEQLSEWRSAMATDATRLVRALPTDREVELMGALFEPWTRALTLRVTSVPNAQVDECLQLARTVFLSAASASDGAPRPEGQRAAAALASLLATRTVTANPAADVQTLVAVSQSLPALLASVTRALLQDATQRTALRHDVVHDTVAWPTVVAELLRFASPARAVFRVAASDRQIAEAAIRSGDPVALILSAANRDPSQFTAPDQLDLRRDAVQHVALGAGTHRCSGTTLVHLAVEVATDALLRHTTSVHLANDAASRIPWIGGFATRAPAVLPVRIGREA